MNNFQCCPPPYMDDEDYLTQQTYMDMFYRIEQLALNVVRWDNLPKEIKQLYIERYLFYFGMCAIFYDDILGRYVCLPVSVQYAWDENAFPTEYEVIGFMGYRRRLNSQNSVLIFDNYNLTPGSDQAQLYASRLTNALRTNDVHLEANKLGKILAVPESQKKSAGSLLKRIKNFALYTIGTPALAEIAKNMQAIDVQPNFVLDRLDYHYTTVWHDVCATYGIRTGSSKLGGVNVVEMEDENSMADVNRCARINPRQDAAERLNEMFGLNVEVGSNIDYMSGNGGDGIGGEGDNGQLHNSAQNRYGGADGKDESS